MKISVTANRSFRDVQRSKKKIIAMKGSAGSGKSVDTAQGYILRLLSDKGRNLLCVRKSEVTNRDSTFAELQSAKNRMGIPDRVLRFTSNPMRGIFANGNEIMFRGVNNQKEQEKLKSIQVKKGKLTDIWVEEATELTRENVDILEDRLRGELPAGLFYQMKLTFNPVSKSHWIKSYYFDRHDDDVMTHHSTYENNRFIDAGYKQRMKRRKELDPDGYRIYGLGEWGELKGLILEEGRNWFMSTADDDTQSAPLGKSIDKEGNEVVYVSQNLQDYDAVAIGQDFGYNHANATILYGMKDDNLFVIRELYVHEKTNATIIALADEMGVFPKNVKMWCDSAEPDRINEWQDAGYYADAVKKEKNSIQAQIDWIKAHRIYVHHSCVNFMKEARQWKWKYNDQTDTYYDVPIEVFDDAMASMRYGIEGWRKNNEAVIGSLDKAMYDTIDSEFYDDEDDGIDLSQNFKPKIL